MDKLKDTLDLAPVSGDLLAAKEVRPFECLVAGTIIKGKVTCIRTDGHTFYLVYFDIGVTPYRVIMAENATGQPSMCTCDRSHSSSQQGTKAWVPVFATSTHSLAYSIPRQFENALSQVLSHHLRTAQTQGQGAL